MFNKFTYWTIIHHRNMLIGHGLLSSTMVAKVNLTGSSMVRGWVRSYWLRATSFPKSVAKPHRHFQNVPKTTDQSSSRNCFLGMAFTEVPSKTWNRGYLSNTIKSFWKCLWNKKLCQGLFSNARKTEIVNYC